MKQPAEEKNKYQSLYDHLSHEYDVHLSEDEMDRLIYYADRANKVNENVGIRKERIEHNPREKAFYEQWQKENEPRSHINYGHGTLQDLFIEKQGLSVLDPVKWHINIQPRERMIVATVIQWLGSNCGFCFLEESLKKCGYKIVKE